jgi:glycosyltransferase involved in cell wall biosynthesis
MNPKILLLSTSLGMGGADRQILYLTRALIASDYEVSLVSMTPLGEMGRQAVAEGLPVVSLNMRRGQVDWRAFQRTVVLLRERQPDILTCFMYHANLLGRLAGRCAGVPTIITSIRNEHSGSRSRDWLIRLTNWMDDCCITNSQQVADSLRKRRLLPNKKLRVIPNGVDLAPLSNPPERQRTRDQLGIAPSEFLWLAIGRLLPQKDYATLLQSFQPLAKAPARLLIAGQGPLLEELQQQTQRLGLGSQVTFLGVRQDIGALLAAADGFVLASAWEGMPNVVMEALAAATPVVATEVGGVSELVQPGQSGFLVPAGNAQALSQAMRQLMALSPEQRRQLGLNGRDHIAANFSLGAMGDRWMALYEELLLDPNGRKQFEIGAEDGIPLRRVEGAKAAVRIEGHLAKNDPVPDVKEINSDKWKGSR